MDYRFADAGTKCESATKLRIVHISDTHMEHDSLLQTIPMGDVIVHSGDFAKRSFWNFFYSQFSDEQMLDKVNTFFKSVPHEMKIFVGGNHDTFLTKFTREEIQDRLPDVCYLQDSSVSFRGFKFYGSPWTSHSNKLKTSKAFTALHDPLVSKWRNIDDDVDVLITHTPPMGMQDWSRSKQIPDSLCDLCHTTHPGRRHAGCYSLRQEILKRVKPKLHLFGHMHGGAGISDYECITFSNAAFVSCRQPHVIDLYKEIAMEHVEME